MEISIIIPVYNKENYLEKCFESIFCQTFNSFEVIAVDDGSTDQSGQICDVWAAKEPRLRVFHQTNGGVTAARRKGVSESLGRFIMFADADDGLEEDALKKMHDAIIVHDADEVIAPFRTHEGIDSPVVYQGVVCTEPLIRSIITSKNRFPVLWSIIFRRELLEDTLDIPREIIEGEDKLMQVKILMKQPKVCFITDHIYTYTLDAPNNRRHTLEREKLYDELLLQTLSPRIELFLSAFKLHQLKEYERFILEGQFEVRKLYYEQAIGKLPAGIPLYDRLVFWLPPLLAWPIIKLYRAVINFKQKGL